MKFASVISSLMYATKCSNVFAKTAKVEKEKLFSKAVKSTKAESNTADKVACNTMEPKGSGLNILPFWYG